MGVRQGTKSSVAIAYCYYLLPLAIAIRYCHWLLPFAIAIADAAAMAAPPSPFRSREAMLAGSLKAGLDWVVQLLLSPFLVEFPSPRWLLGQAKAATLLKQSVFSAAAPAPSRRQRRNDGPLCHTIHTSILQRQRLNVPLPKFCN